MEGFLWAIQTSSAFEFLWLFGRPFLTLLVLYYASYCLVLARVVFRSTGLTRDGLDDAPRPFPDALLLLPTLMRTTDELKGLQHSVRSALTNGYPGRLSICVAIDDAGRAPALAQALRGWSAGLDLPRGADISVVGVPQRVGKAMAMEHGIAFIKEQIACGKRSSFPPVFFNLDADCTISPRALERMAWRLITPRGLFHERPMIVTSNVCVRKSHYWKGWRHFFTVPGQLSIQAAREYTNAIGLGRQSFRLIPVTAVSGALYCTWSDVQLEAPRFGRFLKTLRLRDWAKWWLGAPPPPFASADLEPHYESTIGPGDDTWISWIAMGARWRGDRIDFELPASPWAALREGVASYFSRAVDYDPAAVVFTSSPTSVRALFRQRVRWNSSRLWLIQRSGLSFFYNWKVAGPVLVDYALLASIHGGIVIGLALWPLSHQPATWLIMFVFLQLFYGALRVGATLVALLQEGGIRENWQLLLTVPLSGPYHVVFNVTTSIVGWIDDVLLFGLNTGFAPEETLIKCGTGRIAVAYRVRRALQLAVRAVRRGDVPLGWFWLGWSDTPWTLNGYRGWTTPVQPVPVAAPIHLPAPKPAYERVDTPVDLPHAADGSWSTQDDGAEIETVQTA